MYPERKIITPEYLAAQQDRFDGVTGQFGQIYSRGQNMFFLGRDLLARVTGNQTPSQQLMESAIDLQEARLNLAEVRARQAAQTAPNDILYQQQLAGHFAHQYFATGQEILTALQAENSSLGMIDEIYRFHLGLPGLRLAAGAALVAVALPGLVTLIEPSNSNTAVEIGSFIGATGFIDTVRKLFLNSYVRNRTNLINTTTASLIRRRASINEGQISGDEADGSLPINQELEKRLAQETLAQLQIDGIRRPNFANLTDFTDILAQRESLISPLSRYGDLPELTRSRNIARVSKLTRTFLLTALAAGLVFHHASTREYCGTRNFPAPDNYMQRITGGAVNISSWRGISQNEVFKRIFGRDFDRNNPQDQISYDSAYLSDPDGFEKIITEIDRVLRAKNPQIHSAGPDFLQHGPMLEICQGELDQIFNSSR